MNFLNLGLGELLGLVGAISAGVVALYLLDRSKRHQLVSTLRFWSAADVRTELKHRRRIQQPWSLLLQLISLALLLTAIAGPQLGIFDTPGRDHVIVLDTSAWMGSRLNTTAGRGILMDQAKANARAYLRSIPRRDRVMLVRADALATPATAFESNRSVLDSAIQQSQPGASRFEPGAGAGIRRSGPEAAIAACRRNRLHRRGPRVRGRSRPGRAFRPTCAS